MHCSGRITFSCMQAYTSLFPPLIFQGLESDRPLEEQLNELHSRDVTIARVEALSGRKLSKAPPSTNKG